METLLVLAIVAAAAGWLGFKLYRNATSSDKGCSGGCGCGCGTDPLADYRSENKPVKDGGNER